MENQREVGPTDPPEKHVGWTKVSLDSLDVGEIVNRYDRKSGKYLASVRVAEINPLRLTEVGTDSAVSKVPGVEYWLPPLVPHLHKGRRSGIRSPQ